jgi:acetoin utilization protein AcuB
MPMASLPVSRYMTRSPISIDADAGLSIAATMMKVNRFQHLPVTRKGKVMGVVSARDLLTFNTAQAPGIELLRVGDIARTDLYSVSATEPLQTVVKQMSMKNVDSAIVLEGETIVGIFTTTDALRAFAESVGAGRGE